MQNPPSLTYSQTSLADSRKSLRAPLQRSGEHRCFRPLARALMRTIASISHGIMTASHNKLAPVIVARIASPAEVRYCSFRIKKRMQIRPAGVSQWLPRENIISSKEKKPENLPPCLRPAAGICMKKLRQLSFVREKPELPLW